jgi:dinuclear metal center YbgI/SA1388 family protein
VSRSALSSVRQILLELERRAPSGTAESWDNVGLIVGDPEAKTRGAVVCIDLTVEAIERAKKLNYSLIINHHPCIFPRGRGPSRLTVDSLVYQAARLGIQVVACHTNFDQCALEVVEAVSEGLGIKPIGRLIENGGEAQSDEPGAFVKLVVYVPAASLEAVRTALAEAGAGRIGQYDSCTFSSLGQGTFRGSDDTRPFVGKPGRLETVEEFRLETIVPRGLKKSVFSALRAAHPYEEIAYDWIPLEQGASGKGLISGLGYGFWGDFESALPSEEVLRRVAQVFRLKGFWSAAKLPRRIRRVGFTAGKGSSFVSQAQALGCDLFITGEAGYHSVLQASRAGMAVIELGHRESERFFPITLAGWLKQMGVPAAIVDVPTQEVRAWRADL